MANLKSLAQDTVIYGMSSIVGRFLNYLLAPIYTYSLAVKSGANGVTTEVYSFVALALVLLTFGMETTFFRFINRKDLDGDKVYATALMSVGTVSLVFAVLTLIFLDPISAWLNYTSHPEYIGCMAVCVAIDAFQSIPFAYLRYKHRPIKFATLKIAFIVLNVSLNLVYFILLPMFIDGFELEVGWTFIINVCCTSLVTLLMWKELRECTWQFDWALFREMWKYSWPILILGIAGILNKTADKMLFRHLVPGHEGMVQLGIYGSCVKIAMIMAVITQAFRYAYEPFVFAAKGEEGDRAVYAKAMKYFVIFALLAFLIVMGYMDIIQHFIGEGYREGLKVVPVVMLGEIILGIYFNLSFWYKLIDRTIWGAWFSGIGCAVLITVNILGVPEYGYMACAWAGVIGYGTATVLSYFIGQKYYRVDYPLGSILVYALLTALFFGIMQALPASLPVWARLGINTVLILLFVGHLVYHDFPLSRIPYLNRFFKK